MRQGGPAGLRAYNGGKDLMSDLYIAVYRRALDSGWPYDLGDDPAFQASETRDQKGRIVAVGRVTWGVCRPNVRNAIRPDDLVVFLSTGRKAPFRYQFVGFATVERKIARDAIWLRNEHLTYRCYRNLLIKRVTGGFQHVEFPHFGLKVRHDDWLSRILVPTQRGNADFSALQAGGFLPDGARILGKEVSFSENYVLFRPDGAGSFVALTPPTVAKAATNGASEVWGEDGFSKGLRELLFDGSVRSYVRTRHKQIAHPHIRVRGANTALLCRKLLALCARFHIKSRVGSIIGCHETATRSPHARRMRC
jgi:hypothetical protein